MYYGLRILCLSVVVCSSVWGQRVSARWGEWDEGKRMAVKHRWVSIDGDMANLTSWHDTTVPATEAYETLTLTGDPLNDETVVIDTKTYTFKTVLSDTDGFVLIGATASDSLDNLIAAITLGAGAGTLYAASTTLHPSVTAVAYPGDTMYATAKLKGTDGNSIASTETLTNGSWGGATLSGATQWASDDEILVGAEVTQEFLTNLDWSITTTSPKLTLKRMNVDRTNINFGGPGNPLKWSMQNAGALNYLGTGMMYADFTGPLQVYVNSLTSLDVLNLNVRVGPITHMFVESGSVVVPSGAELWGDYASQIFTTGPGAKLWIQGIDEVGSDFLVAQAGKIINERFLLGTKFPWIVVAPDGTFIQRGIMGTPAAVTGILNLGGVFSYEPTNAPTTNSFEGRFLMGLSRWDRSLHNLSLGIVIQGKDAQIIEGPAYPGSGAVIDLANDFPF